MISTAVLFAVLGAGEVVFLPSPRWTDELKEDVALGYAALPPAARLPLEVELREEATALGLGDATHPLLIAGRLQLYGYREDDDARAATRLSRLTGEERQRLWRRRAVVHAIIRKWDERLRDAVFVLRAGALRSPVAAAGARRRRRRPGRDAGDAIGRAG